MCEVCRKRGKYFYWKHLEVTKMHFFKVLLNDFTHQLRLPKKFSRLFREELADFVQLKGPSGNKWSVRLKRADDFMVFESGWKEFVSDHMLEAGNFLVFRYMSNSCFEVVMFDKTSCEKKNTQSVRKCENATSQKGVPEGMETSVQAVHVPSAQEDCGCSFTKTLHGDVQKAQQPTVSIETPEAKTKRANIIHRNNPKLPKKGVQEGMESCVQPVHVSSPQEDCECNFTETPHGDVQKAEQPTIPIEETPEAKTKRVKRSHRNNLLLPKKEVQEGMESFVQPVHVSSPQEDCECNFIETPHGDVQKAEQPTVPIEETPEAKTKRAKSNHRKNPILPKKEVQEGMESCLQPVHVSSPQEDCECNFTETPHGDVQQADQPTVPIETPEAKTERANRSHRNNPIFPKKGVQEGMESYVQPVHVPSIQEDCECRFTETPHGVVQKAEHPTVPIEEIPEAKTKRAKRSHRNNPILPKRRARSSKFQVNPEHLVNESKEKAASPKWPKYHVKQEESIPASVSRKSSYPLHFVSNTRPVVEKDRTRQIAQEDCGCSFTEAPHGDVQKAQQPTVPIGTPEAKIKKAKKSHRNNPVLPKQITGSNRFQINPEHQKAVQEGMESSVQPVHVSSPPEDCDCSFTEIPHGDVQKQKAEQPTVPIETPEAKTKREKRSHKNNPILPKKEVQEEIESCVQPVYVSSPQEDYDCNFTETPHGDVQKAEQPTVPIENPEAKTKRAKISHRNNPILPKKGVQEGMQSSVQPVHVPSPQEDCERSFTITPHGNVKKTEQPTVPIKTPEVKTKRAKGSHRSNPILPKKGVQEGMESSVQPVHVSSPQEDCECSFKETPHGDVQKAEKPTVPIKTPEAKIKRAKISHRNNPILPKKGVQEGMESSVQPVYVSSPQEDCESFAETPHGDVQRAEQPVVPIETPEAESKRATKIKAEEKSESPKSPKYHVKEEERIPKSVSGKFSYPLHFVSNRRPVTEEEKDRTRQIACSFKPARPAFMSIMRKTIVCKKFFVVIPNAFVLKFLPRRSQTFLLRVPGPKTWQVNFKYKGKGSGFAKGWKEFVLDNNLEKDDACIFELEKTKNNNMIMDVKIFRVVEDVVPPTKYALSKIDGRKMWTRV